MPFIELTDFPASIHTDIRDALTKGDNTVITDNIDRTIDEMKAYLNGRYDTANIFNKTANDRNKYILRLALSITIYYIFLVHNPRKITQVIVDEYERAIETLQDIKLGNLNPEGLPLPAETDPPTTSGDGGPVQWGSDEQLTSSY